MDYLKVEGYSSLLRDPETNSIVNNNMTEYNEYISKRNSKIESNQKMQKLEHDVASLKDDLSEIKDLLRRFSDGSK